MKKAIAILFLIVTFNISAQSYDYDKAEIYSNRFKSGQALTANQYVEAVNLFVAGSQEIKNQGERLLDITSAGSDWHAFHRSYEAIEENYYAVFKILKGLEKNLNKIPEKARATFTRSKRAYYSWYDEFCSKQNKLAGCPY